VAYDRRKFYGVLLASTSLYLALLIAVLTFGPGGDLGALALAAGLLALLVAAGIAYAKYGRGRRPK